MSKNKYELAVVFKPDLSEENFNLEFENIKNMIEKSEATIEKIDQWGKRPLAYEIKKFKEGYYNFIVFSAEPSVPLGLESKLRINENLLRFLIMRHED